MARLDLRMPEGDTIARLPSVDGGEGHLVTAFERKQVCREKVSLERKSR